MKEEITKAGENPSIESNINGKLMDVKKQIVIGSENIIVGVNDDESSKLKVTKEEFANMIRVEIEDTFPLILTFDRYDDNWNVFFKISDFQNQRRAAIRTLVENGQKAVSYLKDYKNLMVSFYGEIIGDISEVEIDQIFEVAYMVERLNEKYSFISVNFKDLKYEFDNI